MASIFQQRHFEAIAEVLQEAQRDIEDGLVSNPLENVIHEIADLFARDNPKFDRGRFERACIPGANVKARTK